MRLFLLLCLPGTVPMLDASSFPEPATVFYGRVINRTSGQTYVLHQGQLVWRILRQDGQAVTLSTRLFPLKDGEFSYRLDVPHQALGLGLNVAGTVVPLAPTPATCNHAQITLDGFPTRVLMPGASEFDVSQPARAANYRLDLEVMNPLADSDGDGIPDWWEDLHRLDDPNADTDGDGLNNLAEFRTGTDPNRDDRAPTLATRELRVYADGATVLMLRAVDADTAPADLRYTLVRNPEGGTLFLRNATPNAADPDQSLALNAIFTQADVNQGRLVFVHQGPGQPASTTSLEVTVQDENPARPPVRGTVTLHVYRPASLPSPADLAPTIALLPRQLPALPGRTTDERQFVANYLLSRELGYLICDAADEARGQDLGVPSSRLTRAQYDGQYVPAYGRDRRHVVLGGAGPDRLAGGMEDDVILGGRGNDTLRGSGGSDLFVIHSRDDGHDVIEDFSLAENDALDLSRVLAGTATHVTNYLQLAPSGTNTLVRVNASGSGGGYNDLVITLAGVQLAATSLYDLIENGHLRTGDILPPTRVTIAASVPVASENGPTPGELVLTRTGSAQGALPVNLQVTGSAANGVDFVFVPPQVTFLAGERSLRIQILPYQDAITELTEVVQITVQPGAGYEVGLAASAQVAIEDLLPQITIEALEPLAVQSDQSPGIFLITRSAILDRSVLVRLNVGGTAVNRVDYDGVPTFINLMPWQSTALITVTPRTTASLTGGAKSVQVSIRPDPAYKLGEPSVARVFVVAEPISFPVWRDRHFAGVTGDLLSFAQQDSGQTGIRHIQRYAFGLDARNPQTSPGRPLFRIRDGRLTVAFRRPAGIQDVQYVVEVSENLVTWHAGTNYVEPYDDPEFASQTEMSCYRVTQTLSETSAMFMRVRVVYAP